MNAITMWEDEVAECKGCKRYYKNTADGEEVCSINQRYDMFCLDEYETGCLLYK